MASAPGRLISIGDRLQITSLVRQKPVRAYVLPGLVAFHVESGAVYALIAYANKWTQYADTVIGHFNSQMDSIGAVIPLFANLDHVNAAPNTVRVQLIDPTTGTAIASVDYAFQPMQVASDVDYANTIDPTEFQRYVNSLTDVVVRQILDSAAEGYTQFMTAGTPTPDQIQAAIKHAVRMAAVDPVQYLQRIQASVTEWQQNLQGAAGKWRDMFNAVAAPALDFAVRVALTILPHV